MTSGGKGSDPRPLAAGGVNNRPAASDSGYPRLWGHIDRLSQERTKYRFRRFTVYRTKEGSYLATVSAVDTEAVQPVICFGGAATMSEAVRQVNRAVAEGRWRADRYAGTHWAT